MCRTLRLPLPQISLELRKLNAGVEPQACQRLYCKCDEGIDVTGHHLDTCRIAKAEEWTIGHNVLNETLKTQCTNSGLSASTLPRDQPTKIGSTIRPDCTVWSNDSELFN